MGAGVGMGLFGVEMGGFCSIFRYFRSVFGIFVPLGSIWGDFGLDLVVKGLGRRGVDLGYWFYCKAGVGVWQGAGVVGLGGTRWLGRVDNFGGRLDNQAGV